ncbi:MAG: glycosyltransferase [Gallionellaceae bacterium]|nr:glycosyltransferase [Gallionellaceae bacterium]
MIILALADTYPMFDRNGAELRFFSILKALSGFTEISFCALRPALKEKEIGKENARRYRLQLEGAGVHILDDSALSALKKGGFDAVYFPYYTTAEHWIDTVRFYQPKARLIVDNGDIHFRRMRSKALLTGDPADMAIAERDKHVELSVYAKADVVIVVSPEDEATLREELPDQATFLIPNIHTLPASHVSCSRDKNSLIFVGAYTHPPNVDAVLFFVNEVLPLVVEAKPDVRLCLIGFAPPAEVVALASDSVEVLGYVAEMAPYLDSSYISIAPIRFGAGVKGKIGDAMAHHLPVVTTSIGIEGFGLTPGENILVGDTPQAFADAVIQLLDDAVLHDKLAQAGFEFIRNHFSEEVIGRRIADFIGMLGTYSVRSLPLRTRTQMLITDFLDRTLLWRFR